MRNRPQQLAETPTQAGGGPMAHLMQETRSAGLQLPATPADVAELVCAAVREERFYILPHPGYGVAFQERMQALLAGGYPGPVQADALVGANR